MILTYQIHMLNYLILNEFFYKKLNFYLYFDFLINILRNNHIKIKLSLLTLMLFQKLNEPIYIHLI